MIGDIVEALVNAGATPEMILAAVRAAEAANDDALAKRRRSDAERQARRRAKEECHVTSRDVTVTDRDPPETKVSPKPLSKTQPPSPPYSPPPPAEISALADELWSLASRDGRDRSGKPKVRTAVSAALKRGASPTALRDDVRRYYRQTETGDRDHSGKTYAKGLHRRIEGDHWLTVDPEAKPAEPPPPEVQARRMAHFRETGEWRAGWGPPPGSLVQIHPLRAAAS